MKRLLLAALCAAGLLATFQSRAAAWQPPGIGANYCKRVGRISGYWMQPSRGPLYDYSSYFAQMYPQIPGAVEYQWQPQQYGYPGPYGQYPGGPAGPVAPQAWGR